MKHHATKRIISIISLFALFSCQMKSAESKQTRIKPGPVDPTIIKPLENEAIGLAKKLDPRFPLKNPKVTFAVPAEFTHKSVIIIAFIGFTYDKDDGIPIDIYRLEYQRDPSGKIVPLKAVRRDLIPTPYNGVAPPGYDGFCPIRIKKTILYPSDNRKNKKNE